jgi:hypothetical protein
VASPKVLEKFGNFSPKKKHSLILKEVRCIPIITSGPMKFFNTGIIYTKIEPYIPVQHWFVCSSIAVSILIPYFKVAPYIPVQHWCILSSEGLQAILHSIISHES